MVRQIAVSDEAYRRLDELKRFFKKRHRKKASFSDAVLGLCQNYSSPEIFKDRLKSQIDDLRSWFMTNEILTPYIEEKLNEIYSLGHRAINKKTGYVVVE